MNTPKLRRTHWRTSSYSGSGYGQCVEVGGGHQWVVPVRDAKDHERPVIVFVNHQWAAFVAGLKSGALDA